MRPGVLAAILMAVLPAASARAQSLPASEVEIAPAQRVLSFPMVDYGTSDGPEDDRSGTTSWRLVNRTGNCCENYLTVTESGRLLDYGGSYINFSDDRGLTWKSVRPVTPLVNGEGAIVAGPGGDILGVQWDPYSGDRLQAYKYDAAAESWGYLEVPYHEPFYDREWVGVVPGKRTGDGPQPYTTYFKGGASGKELWYRSDDGITYTTVSSKAADTKVTDPVQGPLPTAPNPELDWVQSNTRMGMTALGDGRALAAPDLESTWALLDPETRRWSAFNFPGGAPSGLYQVDSLGRIHNVDIEGGTVEYSMSGDGGVTWKRETFTLPPSHAAELVDFRANRQAGTAAVAVRASAKTDVDIVYTLDITGDAPRLRRRYTIGKGDFNSTAGVLSNNRMDFQTVAIYRDGRVAVSVLDSTTTADSLRQGEIEGPELAIEGDSALPPGAAPPAPPVAGPPKPAVAGRHRVKLRVTRRGSRVTFRGTVRPMHPGHLLTLQRKRGRRWVGVAQIRANELSAFKHTVRLKRVTRRDRFRAVAHADPAGRARGVSRVARTR